MTDDTGSEGALSPDAAFAVLGDETRLQILRTLGDADEPLVFSELFERVEYDTTANFSYHLDKLEGHFLHKTEDGYALRQAGRRVVEAVLSGAVTDDPVLEPTRTDRRCPLCDAPVRVSFAQERVGMFCTDCSGLFGEGDPFGRDGHLGDMKLPPAGVQDRSPAELLWAAWVWGHLEIFARSTGLCPRCSAPVTYSVSACEDHDDTNGTCDRCGRNYAGHRHVRCTNCIYEAQGLVSGRLLSNTDLLAFLTGRGINPVAPESFDRALSVLVNYEEEVLSTDPFRARYTYTVDDDSLALTVDDALDVIDVARTSSAGTSG